MPGAVQNSLSRLRQAWPRPSSPRPIVIIGAGGIVNDAHLPAYAKAGFAVAGIFDLDVVKARQTAGKWNIAQVFDSLEQAAATPNVIFDVAVPPEQVHGILSKFPDGSAVLMQKPMGKDLDDARRIRRICRDKKLVAAVNFQLRFSPMTLAIRDAIDRGLLGDSITDVEFRLNLRTPWELFPFLTRMPRVEIQIHTVHYLDFIRGILGEPRGVWAQTIPDPRFANLASTRSSIILDYGPATRCCLSINHNYLFGPKHEAAGVSIQGLDGAVLGTLGVLLNYPEGKPDQLEVVNKKSEWTNVPLEGRWFPDAFVGTMSNVQRFAAGEDAKLVSSVEDAYHTMALVEACYASSAQGATPIPA